MEERIIAYKGFDKDLTCLGFQYEIGKEYHHEGEIKICEEGFHACENPLEVLRYYNNMFSRYCVVEVWGDIDREENETKMVSSNIKIVKEISLEELIKVGISLVQSGNFSSNENLICADVNNLIMSSNQHFGIIVNTIHDALLNNNGSFAVVVNDSNHSKINNCGGSSGIVSLGKHLALNNSAFCVNVFCCGEEANIQSSGDYFFLTNNGDKAFIRCSGDYAVINSCGSDANIICLGGNSKVKAKKGSWITLTEWNFLESANTWLPICSKTEYVDGERIKEDTWYTLKDGEFVETQNQ